MYTRTPTSADIITVIGLLADIKLLKTLFQIVKISQHSLSIRDEVCPRHLPAPVPGCGLVSAVLPASLRPSGGPHLPAGAPGGLQAGDLIHLFLSGGFGLIGQHLETQAMLWEKSSTF